MNDFSSGARGDKKHPWMNRMSLTSETVLSISKVMFRLKMEPPTFRIFPSTFPGPPP